MVSTSLSGILCWGNASAPRVCAAPVVHYAVTREHDGDRRFLRRPGLLTRLAPLSARHATLFWPSMSSAGDRLDTDLALGPWSATEARGGTRGCRAGCRVHVQPRPSLSRPCPSTPDGVRRSAGLAPRGQRPLSERAAQADPNTGKDYSPR